MTAASDLADMTSDVVVCRKCPRLVAWRERVARDKVARFAAEPYWAARCPASAIRRHAILLVGLAPAAHGGNRTGRVFTGDHSGNFLFAALHRAGLSNQPRRCGVTDGLRLDGVYISAVNRCAPPANKPTPPERDNCLPYLVRELARAARGPRGRCASVRTRGTARSVRWRSSATGGATPKFGHGAEAVVGRYALLGSFHVSQQNTFTGSLTPDMLDASLSPCEGVASADRP